MARSSPPRQAGVVSVVIVNYKGADDTIACLQGFGALEWPAGRLELVVVDNASGDGSAERIRAAVPAATVVESPANLGFAGGCNLGVAKATGEWISLINNDARPHPRWVRAAVEAFEADTNVGAVASKVLDWEGEIVDYVDASLTWFGMGYKRECEQRDTGAWDTPADVLFGTGAAMFVRADVWREAGGFDDRYFMFYEDVDLGWRLNLLGWRVRYVPGSLAYHRHHASMKGYGPWREHFLLERNALFTLYKNYGEESLTRVLPAALALAVRRGLARGDADPTSLDLAHGAPPAEPEQAEVSRETLAPAYAVDAFVEHLPGLHADRLRLQAARRRSDIELLPLFRRMMEPAFAHDRFLQGHAALVEAFGIEEHFGARRRIVVVTGEPVTAKMAGPAIRAWAIATALSAEHEVELVTFGAATQSHPRFRCRSVTPADLRPLEEWCDVIIVGGLVMSAAPWLSESRKIVVVDVYNPFHLEQLEQAKDRGEEERALVVHDCVSALNDQLRRGDLLLCASPKQRDFWLGQMAAVGRINPETYDEDSTLESLITVVPFGISDVAPLRTRRAIKGVVPGIGPEDTVIIWGGGVYSWFDPLTLVRAVDQLRHRRSDVRLFFLGLRHPNPDVPEMHMAAATRELSASLGLTGTHVFFNEDWVAYEDRQNYLLDADVGVSTHYRHVETAFSFRTRILDYLWASLPIVATEGDSFADVIESSGIGITVPAEDVDALAAALFQLIDDDELAAACRKRVGGVAAELTWNRVLAPLVEFCRAPRRAPDLVRALGEPAGSGTGVPMRPFDLRADVALARAYWRAGGPAELARRSVGRLRRALR